MSITKEFIVGHLEDLIGEPVTEHLKQVIIKRLHKMLCPKFVVADDGWDELLEHPNSMQISITDSRCEGKVAIHDEVSKLNLDVWVEA
jgi:hypothetical protein